METIITLAGAVLFIVVILILAGIAWMIGMLSTALVVAAAIGLGFSIVAAIIGIVLAPKRKQDEFFYPVGDVRVHGR